MSEQNFIGIEIGGTKLQLVCADASLAIDKHLSLEVNKKNGARGIQQQIEEGIQKIKGDKKLSAVGVGFGGPVNYKTGKISVSHQIAGWEDFNLQQWLRDLTGVPVFIDNDANVAALGEAVHGAGAANDIVFYMTIGSGIGGGMVLNKKIYHGAYPGEVEVGHLRLNKQGDTLESMCSGWTVDEKIRRAITAQPQGVLAKLVGNASKGEARFLQAAVEKGDDTAKKILHEIADNIAFALSHVVHLFHPEVIIIGGGLSLLGKYLNDEIASALPNYVMKSFLPAPRIKIASLGKNVVPVGALELARSSMQ
ncbi:MAG TPA: ROK family protein [Chitinophagaceae bacterium]|nr:ROK family protein [Chitinophagaceae bacterium]